MAELGKEQEAQEQEVKQGATGSEGAETEHKEAEKTAPEGATGEEEASTAEADHKAEKTAEEKERDRKGFESRERRRRAEREEAERLRIENAELRGRMEAIKEFGLKKPDAGKPDTPPEQAIAEEFNRKNPEPIETDFEHHADYVKALARHEFQKEKFVDQRLEERKKSETARNAEKSEQEKAAEKTAETIRTQHERAYEKYGEEDFKDAIASIPANQLTPAMFDAVLESEIGEDVMYYLGTNAKERERIAALPPVKQVKEIGKIEAGISAGTIKTKVSTTTAPPPPPRVQGKAQPSTVDPSKMTDAEWREHKRKQKLENSA